MTQALSTTLTETQWLLGTGGFTGRDSCCELMSYNECVSGLKVEGVYRRCGLATKVSRLVDALVTSPSSAPLESHEQGVLDAASALKQYVREQQSLIPDIQAWLKAAGTVCRTRGTFTCSIKSM